MSSSADERIDLNDHHQGQLVQFLRYSRQQRTQRLQSVEVCFQEAQKSRLKDATYTKEEVIGLLKGLKEVLRAELESELINMSHTSVLLLRQMCVQAEKWHLKLYADLSELESRQLLDAVQSFEDQEFSDPNRRTSITTTEKKMAPLAQAGATVLLQQEIQRLVSENETLKTRCEEQLQKSEMEEDTMSEAAIAIPTGGKRSRQAAVRESKQPTASKPSADAPNAAAGAPNTVATPTSAAAKKEQLPDERLILKAQLEQAKHDLTVANADVTAVDGGKAAAAVAQREMEQLQAKLATLESRLGSEHQRAEAATADRHELEGTLTSAQTRLLEIQNQLGAAEKELEKKFSQTAAYKNMKLMLNKKNQQIKELRGSLGKYEKPTQADDDD